MRLARFAVLVLTLSVAWSAAVAQAPVRRYPTTTFT